MLNNGRLVKVLMQTRYNTRYETHEATPEKYVTINNFNYDTLAETLSFDVKGTLFIPESSGRINISGHFENISTKSYGCNLPITTLTGLVQGRNKSVTISTLRPVSGVATTRFPDGTTSQYFLLTDQFRVFFSSARNFKNIPPGTYKIGTGIATPFQVLFQEYKGLSDPNKFYADVAEDWRIFAVDGTVTITDQVQLSGRAYTLGTINFQASESPGNINYEFKQGAFRFLNLD